MPVPLAARVAHRHLTATRVAERYRDRRADSSEGKFIGKNVRLKWSRHGWRLEELPQKGKRKLKEATLQNPSTYGYFDWWIPGNILNMAKLSSNDDYGDIKKKIKDAYAEAYEKTLNGTNEKEKELLQNSDWVKKVDWYESDVFYLKVTPEGVDDFTAEGKDFTVKVKWTSFEAYSPNSDFQSHDPHYSKVVSSSPAAARKLYLLLKTEPDALKGVSYYTFGDWLNKKQIKYKNQHSQWT